jgi:hypothetical protein
LLEKFNNRDSEPIVEVFTDGQFDRGATIAGAKCRLRYLLQLVFALLATEFLRQAKGAFLSAGAE